MTDPIIAAAQFLEVHLPWLAHRPEVGEALADVAAAARVVAGIARGPSEMKYLGPCGAEFDIATLDQPDRVLTCDGDVYGRAGAEKGACRTCGAEVKQAERRAWLDDVVREHVFTARDIADAHGLNVKTIRTWAERGQLAEHGHDRDGRPLYRVGEVLDLAAESAARRESNRAERERRATTQMGA